jgi:hypothetical protein
MSAYVGSSEGDESKGEMVEFRYLPSVEEQEVLNRLNSKLDDVRSEWPKGYKDFKFTNETLFRFLRSRKHDEEKTFHGLQKHVEWRSENKVHEITAEKIEEEVAKRKIFVKGKDKNARPLVWVIAARHDSAHRNIDVMKDFIISTILQALESNRNERDERFNIVFDLSNFGLACMDYEVVKLLVETLQVNFPDVLEVAYVIDAPFIFNASWAIIRPWLDPVTVAKVNFCSSQDLTAVHGIDLVSDFGAEGPLPTKDENMEKMADGDFESDGDDGDA